LDLVWESYLRRRHNFINSCCDRWKRAATHRGGIGGCANTSAGKPYIIIHAGVCGEGLNFHINLGGHPLSQHFSVGQGLLLMTTILRLFLAGAGVVNTVVVGGTRQGTSTAGNVITALCILVAAMINATDTSIKHSTSSHGDLMAAEGRNRGSDVVFPAKDRGFGVCSSS
jgi:hypothetical protein